MNSMTNLLTLRQAAERCGLSPSTLKNQVHSGRLQALKIGRDWFVTPEALDTYLASRPDDKRSKENRAGGKASPARKE